MALLRQLPQGINLCGQTGAVDVGYGQAGVELLDGGEGLRGSVLGDLIAFQVCIQRYVAVVRCGFGFCLPCITSELGSFMGRTGFGAMRPQAGDAERGVLRASRRDACPENPPPVQLSRFSPMQIRGDLGTVVVIQPSRRSARADDKAVCLLYPAISAKNSSQ